MVNVRDIDLAGESRRSSVQFNSIQFNNSLSPGRNLFVESEMMNEQDITQVVYAHVECNMESLSTLSFSLLLLQVIALTSPILPWS